MSLESNGWHNNNTFGWVYFFGSAGLIKIGWSLDFVKRMRHIQGHSAIPIELLGAMGGTLRTEKILHREFAAHRERGEWFRSHPDILNYIEQRRAAGLMVGAEG